MYQEFKDYYSLLQIAFQATESELKSAYRKMARENHPDLHPEDEPHYTALFQEIKEAYETLSDPQRKAAYDFRYRQLVLQEAPVYELYYDDTPEDTQVYEHKYTTRSKRRFNYFPLVAFGILLFQVLKMVSGMAPVAGSPSKAAVPPPSVQQIQMLLQQQPAGSRENRQDTVHFGT